MCQSGLPARTAAVPGATTAWPRPTGPPPRCPPGWAAAPPPPCPRSSSRLQIKKGPSRLLYCHCCDKRDSSLVETWTNDATSNPDPQVKAAICELVSAETDKGQEEQQKVSPPVMMAHLDLSDMAATCDLSRADSPASGFAISRVCCAESTAAVHANHPTFDDGALGLVAQGRDIRPRPRRLRSQHVLRRGDGTAGAHRRSVQPRLPDPQLLYTQSRAFPAC